jgi:ethanolamine transporter EutH
MKEVELRNETKEERPTSSQAGAFGIPGIIFLIYVVLGILVAATNNYLENLGRIRGIISMVLAILLWPLVLLGVDLHIGRT